MIMNTLGTVLGALMQWCYTLCDSYGGAILLFTILTKIILMPLSIWVHCNGLKVVKMQPEINRLRIKHYGDKDTIAEAQAVLYKREKYNPLASLIPLFAQIIVLMGVIEVIYHPLTYVLHVDTTIIDEWLKAAHSLSAIDLADAKAQLRLLSLIGDGGGMALASQLDAATASILPVLTDFSTMFMGIDLTWIASEMSTIFLLIPLTAGASALFLALMQNRLNPLQHEQGKSMQYGTLCFSVGLALYLGYFVPAGVALYWIVSNLSAVVQQILLNWLINPRKYVDYQALEETREELKKLDGLRQDLKPLQARQLRHRERKDYKRFFSVANKHLVFYSESKGFMKYFEPVLHEILQRSNLTIHYITSDPEDTVFDMAEENPHLRAYYIGPQKLITLLMRMDADVVVMTMPDLENYHYKRSYVRKDIRYIYMFHYPLSTHMVLHTGALDHFDEILCVGDFQIAEIRKAEEISSLPAKQLEVCGYCQLDSLYHAFEAMPPHVNEQPRILIAPSWQEGNILDSCLEPILHSILGNGWKITVRPHPEYMKRYRPRMEAIISEWQTYDGDDLFFETDFSSNVSIYTSDVVITDWSGTATEFSFVTLRPCVFVDTPPKINNPNYDKLGIEPQELRLRDLIGQRIKPEDTMEIKHVIETLLASTKQWAERIQGIRNELIANFPNSAPASAKAILQAVVEQQKHVKKNS